MDDNSYLLCKVLVFRELHDLKQIDIGSGCFRKVERVVVEDCPKLEEILVGKDSFNNFPEWRNASHEEIEALENFNHSVLISSCPELKKIVFSQGCFLDYAGNFEIECKNKNIYFY